MMGKLSVEEARELFIYDAERGLLIWKARPAYQFSCERAAKIWNARFPGREAGCLIQKRGTPYLIVNCGGVGNPVHRLVWMIAKGEEPATVDHINGDTLDNRIENLRSVSNGENLRNQSIRSTNKSGVLGVRWMKNDKKWRAEIGFRGERIFLGSFFDFEEAVAARKAAENNLGFHPNHGRAKAETPASLF